MERFHFVISEIQIEYNFEVTSQNSVQELLTLPSQSRFIKISIKLDFFSYIFFTLHCGRDLRLTSNTRVLSGDKA